MNIELKIYEPTQTDKKPEKLEFYLKLRKDPYGLVNLIAVDKQGNIIDRGSLLTITRKGKIALSYHVNSELGFPLDDLGKIQID